MNNDTAINEIQKAIDEIRQNGEHHAEFVRSNGELVIAGLEMALKPCDDTISRYAAIETLKNHLSDTDVPKSYPGIVGALEEWLDRLPSAQPEIIYCKDCKHHWTHSCMDAFPREICDLDQTFYDSNIDYCSLAEKRTNEQSD